MRDPHFPNFPNTSRDRPTCVGKGVALGGSSLLPRGRNPYSITSRSIVSFSQPATSPLWHQRWIRWRRLKAQKAGCLPGRQRVELSQYALRAQFGQLRHVEFVKLFRRHSSKPCPWHQGTIHPVASLPARRAATMPMRASSSGSFADQDAVTGTFHLRIMVLRLSRQGISPAILYPVSRARTRVKRPRPCVHAVRTRACGPACCSAWSSPARDAAGLLHMLCRDACLGGRDAEANPATVACVPARLRRAPGRAPAHR